MTKRKSEEEVVDEPVEKPARKREPKAVPDRTGYRLLTVKEWIDELQNR